MMQLDERTQRRLYRIEDETVRGLPMAEYVRRATACLNGDGNSWWLRWSGGGVACLWGDGLVPLVHLDREAWHLVLTLPDGQCAYDDEAAEDD